MYIREQLDKCEQIIASGQLTFRCSEGQLDGPEMSNAVGRVTSTYRRVDGPKHDDWKEIESEYVQSRRGINNPKLET